MHHATAASDAATLTMGSWAVWGGRWGVPACAHCDAVMMMRQTRVPRSCAGLLGYIRSMALGFMWLCSFGLSIGTGVLALWSCCCGCCRRLCGEGCNAPPWGYRLDHTASRRTQCNYYRNFIYYALVQLPLPSGPSPLRASGMPQKSASGAAMRGGGNPTRRPAFKHFVKYAFNVFNRFVT